MHIKISSNKFLWLLGIIQFLKYRIAYYTVLVSLVYVLYYFFDFKGLGLKGAIPLGVLGTALSIFLSFRNNSGYDRWWEARKIWGGIVNYSRTFAMQVRTYISDLHTQDTHSDDDILGIHRELIYRHIAWINALRLHLRKQHDQYAEVLRPFLDPAELEELLIYANKPTQLNFTQSQRLKEVLKQNLTEDFRLYELMHSLEEFYNLQGKCERIKNTPFPMYYAFFIRTFLSIFIFMLPISLIGVFHEISLSVGQNVTWVVIPVSIIVSFMFKIIELTAYFTEDPFENRHEDTPMSALCRTIEIDLRQMLRETEVPDSWEPTPTIGDGLALY